jgi:predicted nucleotidyltransferase
MRSVTTVSPFETYLESDPTLMPTIVDTIVQVANPSQVLLFGSRARGQSRRDSDYDFLVVVPQVDNERVIAGRIYRALLRRRLGVAVDIIVVSRETLERNRDNPVFIYSQALREGHILYEA